MIKGIGTDLIEVPRIRESIDKNPRFLVRFFGTLERQLFASRLGLEAGTSSENDLLDAWGQAQEGQKRHLCQTVAANFAGKEAVLKVFGTGLRACKLEEIEILRGDSGEPYVQLSGDAALLANAKGILNIQISLSHTKDNALAFAIGQ